MPRSETKTPWTIGEQSPREWSASFEFMAFGRDKDKDADEFGRYLVRMITGVTTGRNSIQEVLTEGNANGWVLASFIHNDKNGQFVNIWDRGR
jgi:hypothetical protein